MEKIAPKPVKPESSKEINVKLGKPKVLNKGSATVETTSTGIVQAIAEHVRYVQDWERDNPGREQRLVRAASWALQELPKALVEIVRLKGLIAERDEREEALAGDPVNEYIPASALQALEARVAELEAKVSVPAAPLAATV